MQNVLKVKIIHFTLQFPFQHKFMKNTNKINKISRKKKGEIEKAKKNYRRILEEIKPFIKKKKIKEYSTAGKWKVFSYEL